MGLIHAFGRFLTLLSFFLALDVTALTTISSSFAFSSDVPLLAQSGSISSARAFRASKLNAYRNHNHNNNHNHNHNRNQHDNQNSGDEIEPTSIPPFVENRALFPQERRTFLKSFSLGIASTSLFVGGPANAAYTDKERGVLYPDVGEIESSLPKTWDDENPFLTTSKNAFARLDSSPDSIFYTDPRFVEHVDEACVEKMRRYIANDLLASLTPPPTANNNDELAVLDLCSSWTSHFETYDSSKKPLKRVAGLGMNAEELKSNKSLTEYTVQDLNSTPKLPYPTNTFDAVLIQLSIDYLTQPLAVCSEIGRILKDKGTVSILFSNRLFLSKAIGSWTGADDVDHAYIVGSYLRYCDDGNASDTAKKTGLFTDIRARDLSTRNKKGRVVGDPLYVVTAVKA